MMRSNKMMSLSWAWWSAVVLIMMILSSFHENATNRVQVQGFSLSPKTGMTTTRQTVFRESSSPSSPPSLLVSSSFATRTSSLYSQKKSDDDNDNDSWDSDVDYDKGFEKLDAESPDPTLAWGISGKDDQDIDLNKLGIDIGSMLEPLTEQQAAELKAAATEVINERVAAGLDDIDKLRKEMRQQVQEASKEMQRQSQRQAVAATNSLLSKIDRLTDDFMKSTQSSRLSIKQAAAADRGMAGTGRGVDVGSWGTLGGVDVATTTASSTSTSSTSPFSSDVLDSSSTEETTTAAPSRTGPPKLLVVADTKQDDYAKQLIEPLTEQLSTVFADSSSDSSSSDSGGVQVEVFAPTATLPLGGDNAAAVLLFLTSFSSASSVKNALDRLLRKTLSAGSSVAMPPTQLVAISTVGTERTNVMPYSMQNLIGGKLEQRRQMEEAVMATVTTRVTSPPLDYTILKLGDKLVKSDVQKEDTFELKPGDVLDGNLQTDTAVDVLLQAIALQPAARNATLCATGGRHRQSTDNIDTEQAFWDDAFVPLSGPEVWRENVLAISTDDDKATSNERFVQLAEYMREWATLPATIQKLTTPVRVIENPKSTSSTLPIGVEQQVAIQFLYLPTATGTNYMSKDEERAREKESSYKAPTSSSSSSTAPTITTLQAKKLGGLEILVEQYRSPTTLTSSDDESSSKGGGSLLRIRARRCNYAPETVIKELTEESLVARLRKSVKVWQQDHA